MSVRGNPLLVADSQVENLRECLGDSGVARRSTPSTLRFLLEEELWRDRAVKRLGGKRVHFESFREFLETPVLEGLGYSIEEVRAAVEHDPEVTKMLSLVWDGSPAPKHGGKREKGQRQGDSVPLNKRGNSREHRIRRIQRDRPDIYARLKAGEFKSARAAAIAAGIIKVETGLDILHRGWRKATPEERDTFRAEMYDEVESKRESREEDRDPPRRGRQKGPGHRNRSRNGAEAPAH